MAAGSSILKLPNSGIAVVDRAYPKSIHLAYPDGRFEIEVFDPSPGTTRQVVAAGRVVPVP